MTGGGGFLGWHTRVLARARGLPDPVLVDASAPATASLDGADRVLHIAGVNRGDVSVNVDLAVALADALRRCATPPKTVVFANSVQSGTAYASAKADAAGILAEATAWSGSQFVDLKLPNLFGEHGRPHYNSVVATFCHVLASGGTPTVVEDRPLDLLHATDAAALLLGLDGTPPVRRTVSALAAELTSLDATYRTGAIPELRDRFDVRLFNTYRSHCPVRPIPLAVHGDARGDLVETMAFGGQTFASSTRSGATRGEHFHLAKVERFVVLRGDAELRLRRVLYGDVVRLRVSGRQPVAVDMPAMWAHNITNIGGEELLTLFWANERLDPAAPDTYPEKVQ
jgi:UDP-2-acetamido-2,6-beta-L-arabino-hexul-4-ose reductase